MPSKYGGLRTYVDSGSHSKVLPVGHRQRLPLVVAREDVGVALREHLLADGGGDDLLDLLLGGPQVREVHGVAVLVGPQRLGGDVDLHRAGDGVGDDQRRQPRIPGRPVALRARGGGGRGLRHRSGDVHEGLHRRLRGRRPVAGAVRADGRHLRVGAGVPAGVRARTSTAWAGAAGRRHLGARVLAKLGDSVTTDGISPAGAIEADTPAGQYLTEHGVARRDFNSYGSRRGNHEVMIRGTFANIRLRNQIAPGTRAGAAGTSRSPTLRSPSSTTRRRTTRRGSVQRAVLPARRRLRLGPATGAAKGTALLGPGRPSSPSRKSASTARTSSAWCAAVPRGRAGSWLGLTGEENRRRRD